MIYDLWHQLNQSTVPIFEIISDISEDNMHKKSRIKMYEPEQEETNLLKFIHRSNHTALDLFFLPAVLVGKNTGFSYLMDVYGRLRVREYNTLHRAIRKSSWGPVRCNIALHLRMERVMGYSPSNLNAISIPGNFPPVCQRKKR